jgi:uncharacterized protein (DUF433 family)
MVTTLQIQPIPLPLKLDKTGVARVSGTRVTLDTVVRAFSGGASGEEIAQQSPSFAVSDVHATIRYELQYGEDVEKYLEKRHTQAQPSNGKINKGLTSLAFGKDCWRVKINSHAPAGLRPRTRTSTMTSYGDCFGAIRNWIVSVYRMWD